MVVDVNVVPPALLKRNAVVDMRDAVDTYPIVPRPTVVDVSVVPPALLKRNAVVEMREAVETYPADPKPVIVELRFNVDR